MHVEYKTFVADDAPLPTRTLLVCISKMVIFQSAHQPINLPVDVSIWDWLFESSQSPLQRYENSQQAGFTDAITGERNSWKDVKDYSTHISTVLKRQYDFQEGDAMALFSRNNVWYPVAMFAVLRLGGLVSGASPAYSVAEMTYALSTSRAKYLATSPGSIDVALAAAKNVGIPRANIFLLEGEMSGFMTVKELSRLGQSYGSDQISSFKIPRGMHNGDVCGLLSFSSGTTGLPKAVRIAHQNVIAQALQIIQITPATHKKVLAVLPLFHITGLVHSLHLPIMINAEVVMLPEFSLQSMLEAVSRFQIEELLLVPPLIIRLVRDPLVDRYDLSCVKRFSSGAAPISEEILHLLKNKFPGTGFKQGWGMTESCSCLTAHPPDLYDFAFAHTVGTIVASTELKIMLPNGVEGDYGDVGEVLGRGPQVVMGYLDNPAATKETFGDGWLHTGDVGRMNTNGTLSIIDRVKELIKVKGIGVAPAELEDFLLGHTKIEDVAVIGIPNEYAGELPRAYVQVKSGVDEDSVVAQDIMKYVEDGKVRHKWIKDLVFVNQIPKSASGKILRRTLRDRAKAGETVVHKATSRHSKL